MLYLRNLDSQSLGIFSWTKREFMQYFVKTSKNNTLHDLENGLNYYKSPLSDWHYWFPVNSNCVEFHILMTTKSSLICDVTGVSLTSHVGIREYW